MNDKRYRVIFWGTYDIGKPRNRLLLKGLRENGVEVVQCHQDIWEGLEDKSQLGGVFALLKRIYQLVWIYPRLIACYLRMPPHDAVIVGYPGQLDVYIIALFARLRKVPVVLDVFISLYDTIVEDRKIIHKKSPVAFLLYWFEWLASRKAHVLVMDTNAHGDYLSNLYRLPRHRIKTVYVGAEVESFQPADASSQSQSNRPFTVLFYGQFIPLHGIETIIRAAKLSETMGEDIQWILIGTGQEQERMDKLIRNLEVTSIQRISWVPYPELISHIQNAHVCLGIFSAKGKATRVIPNKVFQILAAGKALVTSDSEAIREVLSNAPNIRLIAPEDPAALLSAILSFKFHQKDNIHLHRSSGDNSAVGADQVGRQFLKNVLQPLCR